ncbi:hypothetical protein BH10CYA1_BH10CYA1_30100 [soil metagenome]
MVLTAEILSIFKTALPLCPSCRAEISEDDSFCQECGSALSLPDLDEPVPQLAHLKMARLHPSLGKPVLTLPLLGFAVVGLVLITFFLLGFEKSYSGFSNRYVIEQATQAYKEYRFDDAATMLERLSISHKLDDEQRTLLSDVYLSRSEQRVGRSDYAGAKSDLEKIPSQYSKFVLVTGKRNELVELIKVQQAQAQAQAVSATKSHLKSERSKLRLAAKTLVPPSTNSVLPAPSAISVASPTETIRPGHNLQSQTTRSETPASRGQSPAQKGLLKVKSAKITENDQVRYNELLAGYFSEEHKLSSASSEPPSLKEWIDIGRPKF